MIFQRLCRGLIKGTISQVERRLAKDIQKWKDAGHAFTYKVFRNVGHGGLIAEYTEQFVEEVKAVHAASVERKKR